MTQSTEQERASLRAFIEMAEREGFDTAHQWYEAKGWVFFSPSTADCWRYWQAARREQVVPQGWKSVAELCAQMCESRSTSLLRDGLSIAGCEAKKCAIVLRNPPNAWQDKLEAAAPQPPEQIQPKVCKTEIQTIGCNEAAPVQLPEPAAVIRFERSTPGKENEMPRVISCNWLPDGEYRVHTEHQVRQLLASTNKPE